MGLEITEINPSLDEARPMQKIIAKLIETVFAK